MIDIDATIDELMPDFENPRIGNASTRLEALTRVIELQGEKLNNLAKDIVENGLSPIDRLLLVEDEAFPDHYVVVEGNRRATALIILNNPTLVKSMDVFKQDATFSRVGQRMEALAKTFNKSDVEPIKAVLAPNRASTRHWVEIRHLGPQEGVGVTRWNTIEKNRFADAESRMVVAADFLHKHGGLSDVEKELLDDLAWTTFDRFLEAPKTRALLGLGYENGSLVALAPKEEIAKGLRAIAFKIASGEFDSRKQNSVQQRVDAVKSLPKGTLPDLSQKIEPVKLAEITGQEKSPTAEEKPKHRSKPKRDPKNRDRLFRKSDLNISDKRVAGVFDELCELSAKSKPNACAVLLRVMLEMSVLHYLEAHGIGTQGKGGHQTELHILIDRAFTQMKKLNSNLDLHAIEELVNAKRTGVRMRELHKYVHSRHIFPAHSDLVAMADEITPFLLEIWKV